MRKLSLVLLILSGVGLLVNSALGFRIMPASLYLQVKRGESQNQVLNVINDTGNPINCRVYVSGFEVLRDGKQLFEEATEKYSARNWIKSKESEFEVAPNSTKEVEIEIAVPRNTKSGEYFATIMAGSRVPARAKTPQGTQISFGVNFRIGCITIITVPGQAIRKKAEISEFKVEMPSSEDEGQDIQVMVTLENRSKVHLDVEGEVQIRDPKGRVFDKFSLQGTGKNTRGQAFVFPEGRRDFSGNIQRPLPPGEYEAEVSFKYGYRFQKIRAKTTIVITEEMSNKQKQFLVLVAEPNPLELKVSPGSFRTGSFKIWSMDFERLKVDVLSEAEWLRVRPTKFTIRPGKYQNVQASVSIPVEEPVQRAAKILLKPERGNPVTVDIIVSEYKRAGGEEEGEAE